MNNNNYSKVEELIFTKPSYRFHIRGIARETKLNPNTVINILKVMKKNGMVKTEKKRHIVEVCADIENKEFIKRKRAFNFSKIYNSGIIELLIKELDPESISVIGSYSRGEDIEKSDIDIVAISKAKAKEIELEKYEKILGRKMHLLITDYKDMSDEFYTNLINGMIIYGYLRKK